MFDNEAPELYSLSF